MHLPFHSPFHPIPLYTHLPSLHCVLPIHYFLQLLHTPLCLVDDGADPLHGCHHLVGALKVIVARWGVLEELLGGGGEGRGGEGREGDGRKGGGVMARC